MLVRHLALVQGFSNRHRNVLNDVDIYKLFKWEGARERQEVRTRRCVSVLREEVIQKQYADLTVLLFKCCHDSPLSATVRGESHLHGAGGDWIQCTYILVISTLPVTTVTHSQNTFERERKKQQPLMHLPTYKQTLQYSSQRWDFSLIKNK